MPDYARPPGGLPPQTRQAVDRAVLTEAYAVIPAGVMRDIVTTALPGWRDARFWVLARPMSGFTETFSHMICEIAAGGGADRPEPDASAQAALFVTHGRLTVTIDGAHHDLGPGGFAWIPPKTPWSLRAGADVVVHWLRKIWEPAADLAPPGPVVTDDAEVQPDPMPDTDGRWATTRFLDPGDLGHDMHVTIVTLQPGATIPFTETHVMEHGLYVLEGRGLYRLNRDWVEVSAGDYMSLRAFCPQAAVAAGTGPFRYLLYKDVNRLPKLRP